MLNQILEPWWLEAEENPISFPGSCLAIDRTTFCLWFGIWVIRISKLRLCAYHSGFCGYSLQQQSLSCGLLWIYKNLITESSPCILPLPALPLSWCLMFVEGNGSWVVLFLEVSFKRLRDHPWFALSCYNFFLCLTYVESSYTDKCW